MVAGGHGPIHIHEPGSIMSILDSCSSFCMQCLSLPAISQHFSSRQIEETISIYILPAKIEESIIPSLKTNDQ